MQQNPIINKNIMARGFRIPDASILGHGQNLWNRRPNPSNKGETCGIGHTRRSAHLTTPPASGKLAYALQIKVPKHSGEIQIDGEGYGMALAWGNATRSLTWSLKLDGHEFYRGDASTIKSNTNPDKFTICLPPSDKETVLTVGVNAAASASSQGIAAVSMFVNLQASHKAGVLVDPA